MLPIESGSACTFASLLNGMSKTPLVTVLVPVAPLLVRLAVNENVPAMCFAVSAVIVMVPALPEKGVFQVCPERFVTPPKPPGSRQLISPPSMVLLRAMEKVLHGAARAQSGLVSSPTPETKVRVCSA